LEIVISVVPEVPPIEIWLCGVIEINIIDIRDL